MTNQLNKNQIKELLPHREPMLLIDELINIKKLKSATAIVNVTKESFFVQGHFPGEPVMPGVLIVEAFGQAAAALTAAGIDKSEYENKGLTGLSNVGNTCYLNSCMQILSHTYELSNFLNNEKYKNKLNKKHESVLLLEWDKLRKLMWSENCTIAPMGFVQAVKKVSKLKGRDIFSGYNQNDLPEFLIFLIDSFHTALMREVEMTIKGRQKNKQDKMAIKCYEMIKNMYKTEYSEMLNIFYGTQISTIYSLENGKILSMRPEPYSIISLPIPHGKNSVSIFECMDLYCKDFQFRK